MLITSFRTYNKDDTTSKIYVNGEYFDDGLEDAGRGAGVKVQDETCICEKTMLVAIYNSTRFKREMIKLFDHASDQSVRQLGVMFTGISVHNGVSIAHTAGCILMERWEELFELVKAALERGEEVLWTFTEAV